MKREIPVVLGCIAGLMIILGSFFTGSEPLVAVKTLLDDWYQVVIACTVGVGVINLTQVHSKHIRQKNDDWLSSVILLVCMFGVIIFGIFITESTSDVRWKWLYNQIIQPMAMTVYSTLMFYLGSAAYRSFRLRNAEATMLLIAAVIMMLGRVPVGRVLLGGDWIVKLSDWMLAYPNAAGMRGVQMGATLGGIATALRVLVGIDRGYLSGTGE